jgi:hypothetical protein
MHAHIASGIRTVDKDKLGDARHRHRRAQQGCGWGWGVGGKIRTRRSRDDVRPTLSPASKAVTQTPCTASPDDKAYVASN